MIPDKNGFMPGTNVNIGEAMKIEGWGPRYAFDVFKQQMMYQAESEPMDGGNWQPMTDVQYTRTYMELVAIGFDPKTSIENVRTMVHEAADRNRFDSARLWLDRQQWDGVPRLAAFMSDYCGAAPGDYAAAVGRYLWSAAAGRVIVPGCQCDMVPAFISETQGIGKTRGIGR